MLFHFCTHVHYAISYGGTILSVIKLRLKSFNSWEQCEIIFKEYNNYSKYNYALKQTISEILLLFCDVSKWKLRTGSRFSKSDASDTKTIIIHFQFSLNRKFMSYIFHHVDVLHWQLAYCVLLMCWCQNQIEIPIYSMDYFLLSFNAVIT